MISHPIKIKDIPNKIDSTRAAFYEEESTKIIGNKGMIFKTFKTEKQRIEEYLKNIQFTKEFNKKAQQKIDLEKMKNNKGFIQPKMRYKARTDLERIFDVVNQNSYGAMNKNILNKNLMNLDPDIKRKKGLQMIKNMSSSELAKLGLNINKEKEHELLNLKAKDIDFFLKKQSTAKKHVDNSQAKLLMKELYNKTHFKAASTLSLFGNFQKNDSTVNQSIDAGMKTFYNSSKFLNKSQNSFYSHDEGSLSEDDVEIGDYGEENNFAGGSKVNIFFLNS